MSDVIGKFGTEPKDVFFNTTVGWTDEALHELKCKYSVHYFKGKYAVRKLPKKDIQVYYEEDNCLYPIEWSGKSASDLNMHEIFEVINNI